MVTNRSSKVVRMDVRIIDSIEDELFTVQFQSDHFAELARRGVIYCVPKWIRGDLYQVPVMKHTDLIVAINEMAL